MSKFSFNINGSNGAYPGQNRVSGAGASSVAALISGDLKQKQKINKLIATVCGLMIFVGFFGFAAVGFSSVSNMKSPFPLLLLPMALFIISPIISAFFTNRARLIGIADGLVSEISALDKIAVRDITVFLSFGLGGTVLLVSKLIDGGYLGEYEIIADTLVAKKALHITPDSPDFPSERGAASTQTVVVEVPSAQPAYVPTTCPACGAALTGSKFCPYCGQKL
ncbi:MAG: zinc ribbon domain-containing protein [Clostridiales bacterium]|jgi:hypothetical protein|nr:zinc ribbon domain-containing protein [Clostridiales bacterium]